MRNHFGIQIVLFVVFSMLLPLNLRAQKEIVQIQDAKNDFRNSEFPKDIFSNLGIIPDCEDGVAPKYPPRIFEHPSKMEKFPGHRGVVSDLMPFAVKKSQLSTDVLDSVIYFVSNNWWGKDYFLYEDNPKRLTIIRQLWYVPANEWANKGRITLTYDESGNRLTALTEKWDKNTGIWANNSRHTYTYDDSGNILMELYEEWDTNTGIWANNNRHTYTYDGRGNRLTDLSEYWDPNARSWVNIWLRTCIYDGSGNRLLEVYEYWDVNAGNWVNSSGYACIYDSTGNRLAKLKESWDSIAGIWENSELTIYSYDSSSNMLTELYGVWDTNTQIWVNNWQATYTYDGSGNCLTYLYEEWDINVGSWVNKLLDTFTYDGSGNLLLEVYKDWDTNAGIWINAYRNTRSYNSGGNLIHFVSEAWSNSSWNASSSPIGICSLKNNDIVLPYPCQELTAYYSPATSVDNSARNGIDGFSLSQNFPNPFNPTTSISYSVSERTNVKIAVFNAVGQLVSVLVDGVRSSGNYEVTFDGSNLTSGIYFYKIITDNLVETKRMILVR